MLKITQTSLPGVLILEYASARDSRALYYRTFVRREMEQAGLASDFCEEIAYQAPKSGTLYGIHFQNRPQAQTKLLCCTKGRLLDFAVDLRADSPTYKQWVSAELTTENRRQLYIPAGFGHAALTLEDNTTIVLRIDRPFDPLLSKAVFWRDEALQVDFPIESPILSEKDKAAPRLAQSGCNL